MKSSVIFAVILAVALLVLIFAVLAKKRGQRIQILNNSEQAPAAGQASEQIPLRSQPEHEEIPIAPPSETNSRGLQPEQLKGETAEGLATSAGEPTATTVGPENVEVQAKDFGKSRGLLTGVFRSIFSKSDISADDWQELEDALIMADLGAWAAAEFVSTLQTKVKGREISDSVTLFDFAKAELTSLVAGNFDRELNIQRHESSPAVVLTVGVNGTGKTTTTGKLAKLIASQDREVLLGAADTFRAAAADQLQTWADRVGAGLVKGIEGSDPASVAFDAISKGIEEEADVVLIDTAGRLHTKQGLMDELGKVYRVAAKRAAIDEVLLVIDATTGQNGLAQAKVFSEVVPVTGVVLSKLDGTAKGGIVVAVQQALGVPVKLVGLGEGPDDLAPFEPAEFVAGLLS
ncbi:MAG: signal recognition particle-docking protein FtsY [Actinomycetales bacterium]|nr:signal recognition particle-docking protein FtsY [Actinomycetales bacterium]